MRTFTANNDDWIGSGVILVGDLGVALLFNWRAFSIGVQFFAFGVAIYVGPFCVGVGTTQPLPTPPQGDEE